jgi:hypothetical protein
MLIEDSHVGYQTGSNIDPETAECEKDWLSQGISYPEIAGITGGRAKSIAERNRLVYKIDIWEAFARRVERDGMEDMLPSRIEPFCYWFSGLFDGEGTFIVFTRPCTARPQYSEYRLGIRIMLRDDDSRVIDVIKHNLQIGAISRRRANGNSNPAIAWTCERVKDLAEIIVPLFNKHPLQSKKAEEFAIWKNLVAHRYVDTLGGYSNRRRIPDDHRAAFREGLEAIRRIRTYNPPRLPDMVPGLDGPGAE